MTSFLFSRTFQVLNVRKNSGTFKDLWEPCCGANLHKRSLVSSDKCGFDVTYSKWLSKDNASWLWSTKISLCHQWCRHLDGTNGDETTPEINNKFLTMLTSFQHHPCTAFLNTAFQNVHFLLLLVLLSAVIDWAKVLRPTQHKIGHYGMFPKPISWLSMEKLNLTQQKHEFTNQKKCTTTQNKHKKLKSGLVAFYNIRSGNGVGLFLFPHFINLSFTYFLKTFTHILTAPRPTRGTVGTAISIRSLSSTASTITTATTTNQYQSPWASRPA